MDGPRNRALRYLEPVRRDSGLNVVWNIEHRRRLSDLSSRGATSAMVGGIEGEENALILSIIEELPRRSLATTFGSHGQLFWLLED